MELTIFTYFERHIQIPLDRKFAKRVYSFTNRYLLNDDAIISFYGSMLIGVYPITFKSSLEHEFFSEICKVDKRDLLKDRKNVKAIIPSRKITGDIFNLLLFWLVRKVQEENKLPKKILIGLQRDLTMLFCYRTMSALHNKYFSKYLISQELGNKVVDSLSDLFILKRVGSWKAYMDYRVDAVFAKDRHEHKRLMGNEDEFISVLVKTHGAIRSTVKHIYAVYLDVKDTNKSTTNRSISVDIGDDTDIIAITNDVPATINKVLSSITSKDVFVDDRYINLICSEYVPGYKPKTFKKVLLLMYKEFSKPEGIKIMDLIRDIIAYELNVISENLSRNQILDTAYLLKYLRGTISSSRSSNTILLSLRERGSDLIKDISKKTNRHFIVKTRIAFMLYIMLLTY